VVGNKVGVVDLEVTPFAKPEIEFACFCEKKTSLNMFKAAVNHFGHTIDELRTRLCRTSHFYATDG
jgi:hypothetical protein